MPAVLKQHNLPAETNSFVGRERDLDEVCGLFGESRLVTMCGSGGIGKSRFALRVATRLVDAFPEGVWMVGLAKINRPELVVHEVASVLGVHDEGRPLADMIRDMLRERRLLLIIDNCEHLIDTVAELADQLLGACPAVRILATSREPLKIPGELVWRVPALQLPSEGQDVGGTESVRLFMDRAQAAGSRLWLTADNAATVAGLCRALDGIPLALELAAARTSVLSPGQIAERISDRFVLLTSNDRTAPARHRTLLATVEWSHDLLSERERVLLRRLSVFAGSFDLDLVEQVCPDRRLPKDEILDLMTGLIDKSLVVREGEDRFRLLETIRTFAGDRLREAGERDALLRRHLDVMVEFGAACHWNGLAGPRIPWQRRQEAIIDVGAQLDCLRAGLGWAVESGAVEKGLRLACALMPYWVARGMWQEGRGWYDRLLALDLSQVPPDLIGQTWTWRANVVYGQDNPEEMLESGLRGLELQCKDQATWALAMALNLVAGAYVRLGQGEKALPYAEEALGVAGALDDPWNTGMAQSALAAVAVGKGKYKEAQRRAEYALAAFREHGHQWGIAGAASTLARLAHARGDLEAARDYYASCMEPLQAIEAKPALARCLAGLGAVAAKQRDFDTARASLTESLLLSRATGQQLAVARGLTSWAELLEEEGDLERAVLLLGAATALRESIGQPASAARFEKLLARLGRSQADALWVRGRALGVAEAIALTQGQAPRQSAEPVRPTGPASLLTAREREIVQLITRGLSNKAIADEIYISPATAARHVANILTKLGFTSRTQVAAWALREHT